MAERGQSKQAPESGGAAAAVSSRPADASSPRKRHVQLPTPPGDASVSIDADSSSGGGGVLKRQRSSIYDLHSRRRQRLILLAAAIASILVPFTDTIYLPALAAVGRDLHANADLVAASVSIYMFTVGLGSVWWGPLADKIGRRVTYCITGAAFLGTTLGCVFSPTIQVLVALRALQGLAVAGFMTTGQGVIADVFPPAVRGTANGLFMIPLLVGPLLGPLLGGALSQSFGWRSTFICLAVFAGGIVLPLLLLLVPETHQHKVMRRLHKSDPKLCREMEEGEQILANPPRFQAPWMALVYLVERDIAPYALLCTITFGSMFASLTEWPGRMAAAPYSLSEAMIGVSYLAMGVSGLVSSPIGGRLSDALAAASPAVPQARLIYSTACATLLMPAGLVLYGWLLQARVHIVGPLAAHFVIGFASAGYLPGLFGYISSIKQHTAAAAAASINLAMFSAAGVLIIASVPGVATMGIGPYFTLLAGIQAALGVVACACIWARFRSAAAAAAASGAAGATLLSRGQLLAAPGSESAV